MFQVLHEQVAPRILFTYKNSRKWARLAMQIVAVFGVFRWKTYCFLCGAPVICDPRHIELKEWYSVHTLEIRDMIFRSCQLRNDERCLEVAGLWNLPMICLLRKLSIINAVTPTSQRVLAVQHILLLNVADEWMVQRWMLLTCSVPGVPCWSIPTNCILCMSGIT